MAAMLHTRLVRLAETTQDGRATWDAMVALVNSQWPAVAQHHERLTAIYNACRDARGRESDVSAFFDLQAFLQDAMRTYEECTYGPLKAPPDAA